MSQVPLWLNETIKYDMSKNPRSHSYYSLPRSFAHLSHLLPYSGNSCEVFAMAILRVVSMVLLVLTAFVVALIVFVVNAVSQPENVQPPHEEKQVF